MLVRRTALSVALLVATGGHAAAAQVNTPPVLGTALGPALAVITRSGGLDLYRVAPGTHEVGSPLHLQGPVGAKATDVSLTGGLLPVVCAIWTRDMIRDLICYDSVTGLGQVVTTPESSMPSSVSLSRSGRSIAWTTAWEDPTHVEDSIWYGRLEGGRITGQSRLLAEPESAEPWWWDEECCEVSLDLYDYAWSGEDALLVNYAWDADVNGSIVRADLDVAETRGWLNGQRLNEPGWSYQVLGGLDSSTSNGRVLATEYDAECCYAVRAVELDARSGEVVRTVAIPAPDRDIWVVNGGQSGVYYESYGWDAVGRRNYWAWPDEAHGQRLTGLPANAGYVVAQP